MTRNWFADTTKPRHGLLLDRGREETANIDDGPKGTAVIVGSLSFVAMENRFGSPCVTASTVSAGREVHFGIATLYERAKVRVVGAQFRASITSGFPVRFFFCGECGANIFWEPSRLGHLTGVAAGAFAD